MHFRLTLSVAAVALCLVAQDMRAADAGNSGKVNEPKSVANAAAPASEKSHQAAAKALDYLAKEAAAWRKDHDCATCHHGVMTVWALSEAKNQGYPVGAETLADTIQWTKGQFVPRFNKPRDPRPGFSVVSLAAIYLGVMSQNSPILSRDELNGVAVHLARHQEEDGAWLTPVSGKPPTWDSRETLAMLALLAWEPHVPADPKEAAAARASRERATAWLSNTKPAATAQATALRLLLDVRTGKSAQQIQLAGDALLKLQNADGGWSPTRDLPSDGYATGQALWVLSFAGVRNERPEIGRAISFLVANQREDGSWPMTCRSQPGVDTTRKGNPVAIIYFASGWATLGLVRWVPPALDLSARQKQGFDEIARLYGKFEVDEQSPDKPVVRVNIGSELDDEDLAHLVPRLAAFPQLTTLLFKSPKITDAGLAHLKNLPQLRSLTLENTAITDAGLGQLKALSSLEALNLKGTKVTDAGIQDLQLALPKAKVER